MPTWCWNSCAAMVCSRESGSVAKAFPTALSSTSSVNGEIHEHIHQSVTKTLCSDAPNVVVLSNAVVVCMQIYFGTDCLLFNYSYEILASSAIPKGFMDGKQACTLMVSGPPTNKNTVTVSVCGTVSYDRVAHLNVRMICFSLHHFVCRYHLSILSLRLCSKTSKTC